MNSTPMPTDTISVAAGIALSFRPISPMKPNNSIVIIPRTNICAGTKIIDNKFKLSKTILNPFDY